MQVVPAIVGGLAILMQIAQSVVAIFGSVSSWKVLERRRRRRKKSKAK